MFGTIDYFRFIKNWIAAMNRIDLKDFLIVAMDDDLFAALDGRGLPVFRFSYDGSLADFWIKRVEIFHALCENGVDFIHSDADAIWLTDPIPDYFSNPQVDLTFSQGTIWPEDVLQAWKYVVCLGLFGAKASPRTADFFSRVRTSASETKDDQVAVNRVLLEDGPNWLINRSSTYTISVNDRQILCSRELIVGHTAESGLCVTLLPQHGFQRVPMPNENAFVKHLLFPGGLDRRQKAMKNAGCWFLD
jgi:hypothetical protein